MTTDAERYAYVDPTDAFGNTLTVAPVDASTYTGTIPVVSLGITINPDYTDPENPIVYVPLADVEQVIKAIRAAAEQPETDEQRTDREAAERDHAAGDHQYCGAACEVEMPSVLLRNFIVAKGYPGTAGALDELLRRAATEQTDTETAQPELTATLVINRSDSYCDGCRQPVLPQDTHHVDISGWTPRPGEGCGARFVAMRSDYRGMTDDLKDVRPDLPVKPAPAPAEETTR